MITKLVVATGNSDKLKEISAALAALAHPVEVVSIRQWAPDFAPQESGSTLAENAAIKAAAALEVCNEPVLADDSGLMVDALDGAPGLHSARYAGEQATYQENVDKLLRELQACESARRSARFVCHITLLLPDGRRFDVEESIVGEITQQPRGAAGFGYDPVFWLPERECTLAELPAAEKNRISHRAKAIVAMVGVLKQEGLLT